MFHRVAWFAVLWIVAIAGCNPTPPLPPTPELGAPDLGAPDLLPPQPGAAKVVISEIMYHPIAEDGPDELHEFLEIYNRTGETVDLTGWLLTGDILYAFPDGTTLAPHAYRVIAKDRAALAALPAYRLDPGALLGDYAGSLPNGGGTVILADATNTAVEVVKYNDKFPWPYAPDALGADDEWLALLPTPLSALPHKHLGHSLERVNFDVPASEVSNWVPSPLDGASPGRPNSQRGAPPTIVQMRLVTGSGADPAIHAEDAVTIGVVFSTLGELSAPRLQYFVDDVQVIDEEVTTVPLELADSSVYEAHLPPQPANSIVRYRIVGHRGNGPEVLSPRATDPFGWWAYFVSPQVNTQAPIYHLFIQKDNWNQLFDNVNYGTDDRRVAPGGSAPNRCQLRDSWDAEVPAVFVYDGVVYDTFVRYEGSRWNRTNGIPLDPTRTTISPAPDRPLNRVLSWKINFPNYAAFQGKRGKMNLNKLNQACPGLDDAVGQHLYGDPMVNVPVQRAQFARLHINGGYYHYMMDLEHIDADFMKRFRGPGEPVADLFKADGNGGGVEGPWGVSDESVLTTNPDCPMWTLDQRYEHTYQRYTNDWDGVARLRAMIEGLNAVSAEATRTGDVSGMRAWLTAHFDVQKTLDYVAIRNWSEPWDDTVHNHYLVRRVIDDKWLVVPQDKDMEFGEQFGWLGGRSFFIGERGNIDGRGRMNYIKDAFIRAFRKELLERLIELDATGPLGPARYQASMDLAAASFSQADYEASPAAASACNYPTELLRMRSYGGCRHQDVVDLRDARACTAATCGLLAQYYQTLAGDATRDFAKAALKLTRVDPNINFDWGSAAPDPALPADGFQVRWTGQVTPRYSEAYTFYASADDGVRVTVNGATLVSRWAVSGAAEVSGTISLVAGTPVPIVVEYFDASSGAAPRLWWSSASQCKQPVPTNRLLPM